jgi:hypothetical protein
MGEVRSGGLGGSGGWVVVKRKGEQLGRPRTGFIGGQIRAISHGFELPHGLNLVMACVGVGPSNDSDSPSQILAPGGVCIRGKQNLPPDL